MPDLWSSPIARRCSSVKVGLFCSSLLRDLICMVVHCVSKAMISGASSASVEDEMETLAARTSLGPV